MDQQNQTPAEDTEQQPDDESKANALEKAQEEAAAERANEGGYQ